MRFAGPVTAKGVTRGAFGPEDGNRLTLDFTQGPHGRAVCGECRYDLPDPRAQLVTVRNNQAALEIVSGHGVPSQLGQIEVGSLKASGDIRLPVIRAKRIELSRSWIEANEISGPKDEFNQEAQEPLAIREILMRDSRICCRGELHFLDLAADELSDSFVVAEYVEGITAQGRLCVSANRLMVGVLEAEEVRIGRPDGCHVAQIFCDRLLLRSSPTVAVRPVYDPDLVAFLSSLHSMDRPESPSRPALEFA